MPFENGPNFAKLYEIFPAIFLCKSIQNSGYFFNDSSQTTYSTHSRETSNYSHHPLLAGLTALHGSSYCRLIQLFDLFVQKIFIRKLYSKGYFYTCTTRYSCFVMLYNLRMKSSCISCSHISFYFIKKLFYRCKSPSALSVV